MDPLSVDLSGPSKLDSEENGTWTASVTGGSGSTSYDWEYQSPGSDVWNSAACSGSDCTRSFSNNDEQAKTGRIRVTVTKDFLTETSAQTVEVRPGTLPLEVSLSGPGSLGSGQQGTWTASVTGGSGSTSYSWEYQPPGSSSWNSKGSCSGSSSCSYTFYNSTSYTQYAKIRVNVTDNSRTAQDTKTIAINPPEGPGPLAVTDRVERRDVAVRGPVSETAERRTVELRWSTTGPLPPSTFVVEHRTDSTAAWSKLGTVAARDSAQADGTAGPAYRFQTDQLEVGTHQFRLAFEPSGQAKAQDWTSGPTTTRIELERPYQLSTSPNPARQQATVELAVKEAQQVRVAVYDVLGRRVTTLYEGRLPAQSPKRLRLDVSRAGLSSSGQYFLRVRGETFADTRRLTVVR